MISEKHPAAGIVDEPSRLTPTTSLSSQTPVANTASPPTYNEVRPWGKPTLGERLHKLSAKAGAPLNKAANLVGAEGWWPNSMEQETLKAARTLYSFTNLDVERPAKTNGPKHPTGLTRKSMVKIPRSILQNCAGLAIFNTIRAGAWHGSISCGSGVVVARRGDGTWSPPSSFVVANLGAGLMFGLSVYDCVCVLNTPAQVESFTHPRFSLGGNASVAIGPVGGGGAVEAAVSKTGRPMWSYMKSRGLWAGVQVDGTVMVTRGDANAVFYRERGITAKKILQGDTAWPEGGKPLLEILKALEGRRDVDHSLVEEIAPTAPPPAEVAPTGNDMALQRPPPGYADEKQGELIEPQQNVLDRAPAIRSDGDLYQHSAADEKERLEKSGF